MLWVLWVLWVLVLVLVHEETQLAEHLQQPVEDYRQEDRRQASRSELGQRYLELDPRAGFVRRRHRLVL